jgi:hypothetical protein
VLEWKASRILIIAQPQEARFGLPLELVYLAARALCIVASAPHPLCKPKIEPYSFSLYQSKILSDKKKLSEKKEFDAHETVDHPTRRILQQ